MWANPKLIDRFLREEDDLTDEQIEIIESWRDNFIKDTFIVMRYNKTNAEFMHRDKVYAVVGINNPVEKTLGRECPIFVDAVLIPFKDKITYDTLFSSMPLSFGPGMTKTFEEEYRTAKKKGIITRLA